MTKRKWHKGPPPHVGWWNASVIQDEDTWRWWNGSLWSSPLDVLHSRRIVGITAARPVLSDESLAVEWSDFYPANARVPRIDPRSEP